MLAITLYQRYKPNLQIQKNKRKNKLFFSSITVFLEAISNTISDKKINTKIKESIRLSVFVEIIEKGYSLKEKR